MFVLTLLTAPLAGVPAWAQYGYLPPSPGAQGNGVALVVGWIQQYLHRQPNNDDLANGQAIDAGAADPLAILAGVFGCEEYFIRYCQRDDRRFIDLLFRNVVGRPPSRQEAGYWFNRLLQSPEGVEGRNAVAYALLQRYPPNLTAATPPAPVYNYPVAPPPPPAPTYEYRRPAYRVWRDRDWYEGRYDRDRDRD